MLFARQKETLVLLFCLPQVIFYFVYFQDIGQRCFVIVLYFIIVISILLLFYLLSLYCRILLFYSILFCLQDRKTVLVYHWYKFAVLYLI